MKYIHIIVLSVFFSVNTLGQNQSNDITLITDRSEYVSGENIWFKVHLQAELKKSKLIYAEIISPFGYVVNRKKVLTNNGIGNGNFVISDTVSTGNYTFLIYTNGLKNKGYERFYKQNILIYNPEKKIITKEKKNKEETIIKNKQKNKTLLSIEGLEESYQTRSKVSFLIKHKNIQEFDSANLCISVKKSYTSVLNQNNNSFSNSFEYLRNDSTLYYQEINGVIISGQIKNANKEPLAKLKVYLCNVDSVSIIQTSITNNNGRFHFLVPVDSKLKDIVINSESNEDVTIVLDNKFINNYSSSKGSFIEELDSQKRVYLNQLYINHRINKLYTINQIGDDNVIVNERFNKNNFYDYTDKAIKFDNYIVLDSIQEYFHEFFPSIIIQNKEGKREFKIINKLKGVLLSQPAIFIDGVLYSNNEILFSINPEICDRIEVVKSNYLIFDKIYGGIICLYTKNSDLSKIPLPNNSSRIEYSLYDDSKIFSSIQTNNITPNFQNTLYWNPNIIIGKNNTVEIEFETGDAIGDYIIEIKGYIDSNNFINESRRFTIIREVN